ncbi:MAG: hypothetical protein R3C49_14090 [Planctomycetaceae bacterium]
MFGSLPLWLVAGLLLAGSTLSTVAEAQSDASPSSATAEEADAGTAAGETEAELIIRDANFEARPSAQSLSGPLLIQLSVTNVGSEILQVRHDQFTITVDGKPMPVSMAVPDPLLANVKTLPAGAQATGWVSVNLPSRPPAEPEILVQWKIDDREVKVSVNAAVREMSGLTVERPDDRHRFAVVTINRSLEMLSLWMLNRELKGLKDQGVEQLVLVCRNSIPHQSTFYRQLTLPWLGSVSPDPERRNLGIQSCVVSPFQFTKFVVADGGVRQMPTAFQYQTHQFASYQPDRERAVAEVLREFYEDMPLAEALADLQHAEPGIRRAVLETNIDRMTETQLREAAAAADQRGPDQQVLLADQLHRVAVSVGVEILEDYAHRDDQAVRQAAIRSLIQCVSPQAVAAVRKLSQEVASDPEQLGFLVSSLVSAGDYRQADLVADHAEELLKTFLKNAPQTGSLATGSSPSVPRIQVTRTVTQMFNGQVITQQVTETADGSPAALFFASLSFLKQHNHDGFRTVATQELLNIATPGVQDQVLSFLLGNREDDAELEPLVRSYIEQRLADLPQEANDTDDGLTAAQRAALIQKYSPRSTSPNSPLTESLFHTIARFPDSQWTPVLLGLSKPNRIDDGLARIAFQAALMCSSSDQLDQFLGDFNQLDALGKSQILNHLGRLQDDRGLELAKQSLRTVDGNESYALRYLGSLQSPEAFEILTDRMNELREELTAADAPRESAQQTPRLNLIFRILEQLQSGSQMAAIPKTRRAVNRLRVSGLPGADDRVLYAIRNSLTCIPRSLLQLVQTAYEHEKVGKYEEALPLFQQAVEFDPFYYPAHSGLASLYLRFGDLKNAAAELKIADELNPEDVHTQSMIALSEIRQGHIRAGLDLSEKLLKSIPETAPSVRNDTLYNTACSYGRAFEVEPNAELREKHLVRGIELLWECVNQKKGFDEPQHAKQDPDLNAFHNHKDWEALLAKMEHNAKSNPRR